MMARYLVTVEERIWHYVDVPEAESADDAEAIVRRGLNDGDSDIGDQIGEGDHQGHYVLDGERVR